MTSATIENEVIAQLELHLNGEHTSRPLRQGERLFVGSDESSDMCIPEPGVAPTHCAVTGGADGVTVEDCYSIEGTFVNGQKVRSLKLTGSSELRVGSAIIAIHLRGNADGEPAPSHLPQAPNPKKYRIPDFEDVRKIVATRPMPVVTDPAPASAPAATESSNPEAPPAASTASPSRQKSPARPVEPDESSAPPSSSYEDSLSPELRFSGTVEELRLELLQAQEQIRVLQRRLESSARNHPELPALSDNDEMVELLRAEVLELQAALADAFEKGSGDTPLTAATGDVLPRDEAEKLLERLEELLAELQQRDEQIATLTELLQLAEETNRREKEERDQIDSWLHEIEDRFGRREQEWQAECDELRRACDAVTEERDRAETALRADSTSGKLEAAQNVLQGLRDVTETQKKQLWHAERTIQQLHSELEDAKAELADGPTREERVLLAQQQAIIARLKQELETLQRQQKMVSEDECNMKLRALRQHLSEIHAEERAEREERRLSNRLSKLWRRLDGR